METERIIKYISENPQAVGNSSSSFSFYLMPFSGVGFFLLMDPLDIW
jgi:hypothetical protein